MVFSNKSLADGAGHTFFIFLDRSLGLRMVTRPGRKLAIAHAAKFPAQGLLGDRHAELLEDPLAEIDDPPAHDAMYRGDRPALDDRGKRCPMGVVEPRGLSRRLAIDQPLRDHGR